MRIAKAARAPRPLAVRADCEESMSLRDLFVEGFAGVSVGCPWTLTRSWLPSGAWIVPVIST